MWKKYCNSVTQAPVNVAGAWDYGATAGQGLRAILLGLLLLSLFPAGCAVRKPEPPAPAPRTAHFLLADGKELSDQALAQMAGDADYVLMGEQHDNAAHHKAQAALIGLLAQEKRNPVVGLEMLPRRQYTAVLQDFSAGRLPLRDLPEAVNWRENWGFPFALYEPVFAVAQDHNLPVYGLNIPNDLRRTISRKGLDALTPAERAALPARIIPPLPQQREELAAFFVQHNAMRLQGKQPGSAPAAAPIARTGVDASLTTPVTVQGKRQGMPAQAVLPVSLAEPFERFLLIQSLWDSTMAEEASLLRRRYSGSGGPIVILAGSGHVDNGYGIAHRLRLLDPGAHILTVAPARAPAAGPHTDPSAEGNTRPEGTTGGKSVSPSLARSLTEPGVADVFYYSPTPPRSRYGLTFAFQDHALHITGVAPGSPAAKAGIEPGDRILRAASQPVRSPADLHTAARQATQNNQPLTLLLERNGKQFTAALPRR